MTTPQGLLRILPAIAVLAGVTSPACAASATAGAPDRGFGLSAAVFDTHFFSVDQVTPGNAGGVATDLQYRDAFGGGYGYEAALEYRYNRFFGGALAVFNARNPGRYAAGGEFPDGIRFSDFRMAGFVLRFNAGLPAGRWTPHVQLGFGAARLSPVDADTGSGPFRFWHATTTTTTEFAVGTGYRIARATSLELGVRFVALDDAHPPKPAAGFVSQATAASSRMFYLGIERDLR